MGDSDVSSIGGIFFEFGSVMEVCELGAEEGGGGGMENLILGLIGRRESKGKKTKILLNTLKCAYSVVIVSCKFLIRFNTI